jgi:glycosyltransferase involved in cell wall biosynthesis
MRFSVLLPTRNGGRFLDNCIRSVLSQDGDFELVVSDNASDDETPQVIDRWRRDPRLKALRLSSPVTVTENWNAALQAARGDYAVMLGDDDYLLPDYFSKMDAILKRNNDPDCVIYNGYSYIAPGSIGGAPCSFYRERHFAYGPEFSRETVLDRRLRHEIVEDMYRFNVRIPLNMQTALIRRDLDGRVAGGIFQPPFPDHFALNALLLTSDKWVFSPQRLIVVGVSPKSFGHYVYNNAHANGLAYLGITAEFPGRLPGNELLNGMHVWLTRLKESFPEALSRTDVDRAGYVRRQVYAWLMQYRLGTTSAHDVIANLQSLTPADWLGLAGSVVDAESWRRLWRIFADRTRSAAEQQWRELRPLQSIDNIGGFATWLTARRQTG